MYSNSQSIKLFEYDFTEPVNLENKVLDLQSPIDIPRFLAIDSKPLNAMDDIDINSIVYGQQNVTDPRLLSLKDILQKQEKVYDDADNNFECYLMNDNNMAINDDSENAKTIIVKRIQLQFDETESTVINFTDITAYIRLK